MTHQPPLVSLANQPGDLLVIGAGRRAALTLLVCCRSPVTAWPTPTAQCSPSRPRPGPARRPRPARLGIPPPRPRPRPSQPAQPDALTPTPTSQSARRRPVPPLPVRGPGQLAHTGSRGPLHQEPGRYRGDGCGPPGPVRRQPLPELADLHPQTHPADSALSHADSAICRSRTSGTAQPHLRCVTSGMAATPDSDRHRRNARLAMIRLLWADLIRSGVRSDWLPVWLPGSRTISASRIWIAVLPGERLSDCSPATRRIRMNDCLRAVHHRSDDNFEYMELPASTAPRAGFEPAAYCLGGSRSIH